MRTLIAAAVAGLLLATPAAAQDPAPAPGPTSYFFTCTSPTKVETAGATWGTVKPTASFTAGAGCGSPDPGLLTTTAGAGPVMTTVDFIGGGTHTGPIQAINVELHSLLVSRARARADIGGVWELLIDGNQVALEETLRITPETSSTGVSEKYVFSFSRKKPAGSTVVPPLAAGTGEHTVQVRFSSRFLDYQNLWVWGATEVPAGVTINPAQLAAPTVNP